MPITKSAKKALRSSEKKRVFNLRKKAKIVESRRVINKLLNSQKIDKKNLVSAIADYYSALDKAVKTNYIHKNNASRSKSRMQIRISKALGEYKSEFAILSQEKKNSKEISPKKTTSTKTDKVKAKKEEPKKTENKTLIKKVSKKT